MSRIKICGLMSRGDIRAVNRAMPDYCGFVIEVEKSRRSVDRNQVKELVRELDSRIVPVGVFVNAMPELPIQLLEEGIIGMAQLHGQEDEAYIQKLRSYTEKPLIQAFSIKKPEDVKRACESRADYILLDQGGGGTGQRFDWSLVHGIPRQFFLAGGLSAENLSEAIESLSPWAVDLSSSLETEGRKNPEKIREAVDIVRKLGPQG